MSFKVIKPGFYTTVQDAGRFGFADRGLAQSGVMDDHAYRWANYLLDNAQTDAVLEITFGDCQLEALAPSKIAITGADMQLRINGVLKENWHSHAIKMGDQLSWQTTKSGVRAYLAVKNGLNTTAWFGSRAVNKREQIGQLLQAGDWLAYASFSGALASRCVPLAYQADYTKPLRLHLLPSYQFSQFMPDQIKVFFNNTYQIGLDSDRTGYRFLGKPIQNVPAKMTSEGMVVGSVEITPAGLPIILLNDAPTIGGYLKIGVIVREDINKLVQRQVNSAVKFTLTNIDEAQQRKREWLNFFSTVTQPTTTAR